MIMSVINDGAIILISAICEEIAKVRVPLGWEIQPCMVSKNTVESVPQPIVSIFFQT